MDDVRYWMIKETAPKPLAHARGSQFNYSKLGYIIAGAIVERIGRKTWEELITSKLLSHSARNAFRSETRNLKANVESVGC